MRQIKSSLCFWAGTTHLRYKLFICGIKEIVGDGCYIGDHSKKKKYWKHPKKVNIQLVEADQNLGESVKEEQKTGSGKRKFIS